MIVHVDLFFNVSDDFDGDISDILQKIIEYRKLNSQEPHKSDYSEEFDINNSISKSGYDRLMTRKLRNDKNLVGAVTFIEYID